MNVLNCSYVFFTCSWLFITWSCINTSFDPKSISKIEKTCLFNNSFKTLNLGYHHPHTFTRIYFSIRIQCLINWIRVITCTHFKFNMQIDWYHIGWCDMNVGHRSLEDRFHRVRWVPNTFPPCNIASKLKSRVSRSNAYTCNF